MEPRSPLEYTRDREIADRAAPARNGAPTLTQSIERTIARIPRRVVPNPKGRKPQPTDDVEIPRTGSSGSGAEGVPRHRNDVPRRRSRSEELSLTVGIKTRPEEQKLLAEVGKFRIAAVSDLVREIYKGQESQLRRDLTFLKQHGLVENHFINLRRDGRSGDVRRFEAITLTKSGKRLLIKSGLAPEDQRIYSGLVKPREAEHDAQIYRAYVKEAAGIEAAGGRNLRVKLDFELKAQLNRAAYLAKKVQPGKADQEIKADVAHEFNLTVMNNKVVVPDLRIEYELPSGGSAQVDVEVATSAYRHGHIAHKVQAGFRMYVSSGDIGRLGAAIRDDHNLMSEILDI